MPLPLKVPTPLGDVGSTRSLGTTPWRWLFSLYFIALTVATHWPRLDVLGKQHSPPDKLMHFLAFGILAVLLERSRWLPAGWMAFLAVAIWVPFDEWTQDAVSRWRDWSLPDVLAGLQGVAAASLATLALAPPKKARPGSQWARIACVCDRFLDRGTGGRLALATGALATSAIFPALYFGVWLSLGESWGRACGVMTIIIALLLAMPLIKATWRHLNGPPWPTLRTWQWGIVACGFVGGWFGGHALGLLGLCGLGVPTALLVGIASYSHFLHAAWRQSEPIANG